MRITRIGGALLVFLGLVMNVWTLETFVVPDGSLGSNTHFVITAQLAFIAAGIWLLIKAPRVTTPSAANCVILVASTLFSLGVAEIALRFIFQPEQQTNEPAYVGQFENRPSKRFETDTDTGWRMGKNHDFQSRIDGRLITYRSNGQGFRSNRDFDHSPKRLIALTGDSMTWGTGVDYSETFGDRLEANIAGSEVFNFAMPGFGLDQMWMSVRHHILPLKPDLVIVAFIDDDFARSLTAFRKAEGFNKPRFLVDLFGNLRSRTSADVENSFSLKVAAHSRLWKLASGPPLSRLRPFSEWWALNTAILEAIASDCESQKVPVLFIRVPREPLHRFDSLGRFMQRKGFEFLDLGTPDIPRGLHFENDGHINAEGHQFVAGKITEWMEKRLPHMVNAGANRLH